MYMFLHNLSKYLDFLIVKDCSLSGDILDQFHQEYFLFSNDEIKTLVILAIFLIYSSKHFHPLHVHVSIFSPN